jgi:DNA-binding MarR family transcriptional regulator
MQPTNAIGFLINHLAFLMMRQSDQVLQERLGIGFSQFKILKVLQTNPQVQQKQIADALGQTEASISRQIKLMHDSGLLQTTVRPENRRRHLTTLTRKGARISEEAIVVLNAYHKPMFDNLGDKQQQQLVEILQKMHAFACASSESLCQSLNKKDDK